MNNVLILGFGSIGRRHYNILKSILPNITIDVVSKSINIVDGSKVFKNLEDIESLDKYDYFIIASETVKHYEHLYFIDNNVKSKIILVEKPLFTNYKNYIPKNNFVFVGYNLRFHPIIKYLKEETCNKKILYVNVVVGQYLPMWRPDRDYRNTYSAYKDRGGGVLLDLSHEIDYVQWLCGKLNNVYSINSKISSLEIDSDDIAILMGTSVKNTVINISMDYISKIPVRRIILYTDDTTYIGDLIHNRLDIKDNNTHTKLSFDIDRNYSYIEMHKELIYKNIRYICKYEEGLAVMETISKVKGLIDNERKL